MPKKTLTVLICALNEEKNIGHLLQDVLDQDFDTEFANNFALQKIVVVSDGSTDKTAEIVNKYSKQNSKITLLENEKRIGKIFSLDKAFHIVDTDYVILFDADVRLQKNTIDELTRPLIQKDFDLVGGNPIPTKPKSLFNIAGQASYFSWLIVQKIKEENPSSIYSAHGRILLASKKLYKSLDISGLSTPGDDQYMYLKSNHNFYYQKDAVVFYSMPNSIEDYLKQNVRFRKAKLTRSKSSFGEDSIKNEFKIKNKFQVFIKTALKSPYKGLLWLLLYAFGYFKFKLQVQDSTDINKIWGEVKSTK